eukprot:TRINITY_DN27578_c0_g1_i1.p1 TRINITY_DN27578_c0_g1~~TRINITY_DN27578_c0_g1_i1.p1  ORF type:complete len:839 (-),score=161.10 TRINITY_DN27578_c0_g1_i1:40-2556(-)
MPTGASSSDEGTSSCSPERRLRTPATPRYAPSDLSPGEASLLGRCVLEDGGCSLRNLAERARGPRIDVAMFEDEPHVQYRKRFLNWYIEQFNRLGYRDEWLASMVSLADRAISAAMSPRAPCRPLQADGRSVLQEEHFWLACALIALKMSEAEAELDAHIRDVVLRLALVGSRGARLWNNIRRAEFWICALLDFRLFFPTPFELTVRLGLELLHAGSPVGFETGWRGFVEGRHSLPMPVRSQARNANEEAITEAIRSVRQCLNSEGLDSEWTALLACSMRPLCLKSAQLRNILVDHGWLSSNWIAPPDRERLLNDLVNCRQRDRGRQSTPPVQPFVALACFLVELAIVHAPATCHRTGSLPIALPIAAFRLALRSFSCERDAADAPPRLPPQCYVEALRAAEHAVLPAEEGVARHVAELEAVMLTLWVAAVDSTTEDRYKVAKKWRERAAVFGGRLPVPPPLPRTSSADETVTEQEASTTPSGMGDAASSALADPAPGTASSGGASPASSMSLRTPYRSPLGRAPSITPSPPTQAVGAGAGASAATCVSTIASCTSQCQPTVAPALDNAPVEKLSKSSFDIAANVSAGAATLAPQVVPSAVASSQTDLDLDLRSRCTRRRLTGPKRSDASIVSLASSKGDCDDDAAPRVGRSAVKAAVADPPTAVTLPILTLPSDARSRNGSAVVGDGIGTVATDAVSSATKSNGAKGSRASIGTAKSSSSSTVVVAKCLADEQSIDEFALAAARAVAARDAARAEKAAAGNKAVKAAAKSRCNAGKSDAKAPRPRGPPRKATAEPAPKKAPASAKVRAQPAKAKTKGPAPKASATASSKRTVAKPRR